VVALPSLNRVAVKADARFRPGTESERAELRGVLVDPRATPAEQLGDVRDLDRRVLTHVRGAAAQPAGDHARRVTTTYLVRGGLPAVNPTAPVAVARIARALTYLACAFVIVALLILLLGFFLLLFGANPDAPFAEWVYRCLPRVMAPFRGCSNRCGWTGGRSSTSRSCSR
jgi:hypothetical protein